MKGTKKGNTGANNNAKGLSKITSKVAKRGKAVVAAQSPRSPKVNKEQCKTVKEKPPVKRRIILSKQTKELNDSNNNALPSCSSANETNVFIAEQESENGVPSSKGNETKPKILKIKSSRHLTCWRMTTLSCRWMQMRRMNFKILKGKLLKCLPNLEECQTLQKLWEILLNCNMVFLLSNCSCSAWNCSKYFRA